MSEQETPAKGDGRDYFFNAEIGPLTLAEKEELKAAMDQHIVPILERIEATTKADGYKVRSSSGVYDFTDGSDHGEVLPCGHTAAEHEVIYRGLPASLVGLLNAIASDVNEARKRHEAESPIPLHNPFNREVGRA